MEVTGCLDGCVGVGCVWGAGWWWVSEFLTSSIVYMLILTINMNRVYSTQFGEKVTE